jgi:hypothetical protein
MRLGPAVLLLALAGCGLEGPSGNHTLRIHNESAPGGACKARRFDYGLISADGATADWEHKFYARPGETVDVPVEVPAATTYMVRLWAQVLPNELDAQELRWLDVAMAPGGTTEVHLVVDDTGWLQSTVAGQAPAFSSVACN